MIYSTAGCLAGKKKEGGFGFRDRISISKKGGRESGVSFFLLVMDLRWMRSCEGRGETGEGERQG